MDSTAVQSLFRKNLTNVMEWKKNVITIQDVTIVSFFCRRYKILTFDITYKSCYLGLNRYMKCSYIASLVKIKSESKIEIFG